MAELRANVTALAKLATLQGIPVITTASVPDGPNGPLMPEIHEAAPHAVYVPRKGEVNAWDNALFVSGLALVVASFVYVGLTEGESTQGRYVPPHVVNGKVANEGSGAKPASGKILFQSEGAEVYFRNMELRPIKK